MDSCRLVRSAFLGFSDDLIAKKQTNKQNFGCGAKKEKDDVNERAAAAASAAGDVQSGRDCGGR